MLLFVSVCKRKIDAPIWQQPYSDSQWWSSRKYIIGGINLMWYFPLLNNQIIFLVTQKRIPICVQDNIIDMPVVHTVYDLSCLKLWNKLIGKYFSYLYLINDQNKTFLDLLFLTQNGLEALSEHFPKKVIKDPPIHHPPKKNQTFFRLMIFH